MIEQFLISKPLDVISERSAYQKSICSLMNKPSRQVELLQFGFDGDILERFEGVPGRARLVSAGPQTYRHYTNRDFFELIIKEAKLRSGKVPYARTAPLIKIYYDDLRGVFVTSPNHKPERVGVPDKKLFVDFTLPDDLSLIHLEDGIWLIPGIEGCPIEISIPILKKGNI